MYCYNCGAQIDERSHVCPFCGAAQSGPAYTAAPPRHTGPYYSSGPEPTKSGDYEAICVIGMALSIISFFGPGVLFAVAGIVMGIIGLVHVNKYGGKGKGFAVAAIIVGAVSLVLGLIVLLFGIGLMAGVFEELFDAMEYYCAVFPGL